MTTKNKRPKKLAIEAIRSLMLGFLAEAKAKDAQPGATLAALARVFSGEEGVTEARVAELINVSPRSQSRYREEIEMLTDYLSQSVDGATSRSKRAAKPTRVERNLAELKEKHTKLTKRWIIATGRQEPYDVANFNLLIENYPRHGGISIETKWYRNELARLWCDCEDEGYSGEYILRIYAHCAQSEQWRKEEHRFTPSCRNFLSCYVYQYKPDGSPSEEAHKRLQNASPILQAFCQRNRWKIPASTRAIQIVWLDRLKRDHVTETELLTCLNRYNEFLLERQAEQKPVFPTPPHTWLNQNGYVDYLDADRKAEVVKLQCAQVQKTIERKERRASRPRRSRKTQSVKQTE